MSAYRCELCGERYPPTPEFAKVCLECGSPTYFSSTCDPSMSVEDARSRLRQAQFAEWCALNGREAA